MNKRIEELEKLVAELKIEILESNERQYGIAQNVERITHILSKTIIK